MSNRRAVVLGSGGQLGGELVRLLHERGWEVVALNRRALDVTNAAVVESELASHDPAVVINAAAYNQVDLAEQEPLAAYQTNALAVRSLALACRQLDAKLVHYSTDYVFDGQAGRAYDETDLPHPLSAYGVSKLAGELYAGAYLDQPLVIRTSGVFGPRGAATPRGNFVETMLRLAQNGQPLRVIEDHTASPTYAPALAWRSLELLDRGASGLFHIGGGEGITWFEYARLIFRVFGLNPDVRPTSEREYRTPARRPRYSVLSNAKLEAAGVAAMPSLEEALHDYRRRRPEFVPQAGAAQS